jgi:simple sugar transport system ATP-binding protein
VTLHAAEVAATGITKRFGSVTALDDVALTLKPGRVHALLGENGAGKSTLMGVLFGLVRPDRGTVSVGGVRVVLRSPRDAIRLGIGMVHQHFSHVPALTVAENVALGGRGRFDQAAAARHVESVARAAGLALDPLARVCDLSVGAQQRLEIVRALAHDARALILDEPTAVLSPDESAELLRWLRSFANAGGTVALVTHKVVEALAAADDVTVLRSGHCVAAAEAASFTPTSLARTMFPDAMVDRPKVRKAASVGEIVARASHLVIEPPAGRSGIRDASFELLAGQVAGIAAVEGSGHESLLRALAGLEEPSAGSLQIPENVSFIPADRHRDGLVLEFPLYENLALRHAGSARGRMRWPTIRARTRAVVRQFEVRADSEASSARTLSGGNQQRFVLGRELESHPPLVVAENPTRGLDLMATAAVHSRLLGAAAEGAAVVVYSGDLDEVLALADRVLVVYDGIVRELPLARDLIARGMVGDW